eukprot:919118-Pelagomonas_calceolata.AAC.14
MQPSCVPGHQAIHAAAAACHQVLQPAAYQAVHQVTQQCSQLQCSRLTTQQCSQLQCSRLTAQQCSPVAYLGVGFYMRQQLRASGSAASCVPESALSYYQWLHSPVAYLVIRSCCGSCALCALPSGRAAGPLSWASWG